MVLDNECTHESWECSGRTGVNKASIIHACTECDIRWTNSWSGFVFCDVCAEGSTRSAPNFVTKDSGERQEYVSGMRRDTQTDKPRFDLLLTDGLPYDSQFLTRFAALLQRGADKYGERNWQLANSSEELARFKASALRHMMQWACGERDEDHAAAVAFNLMAFEYVKWKLDQDDPWPCGDCGYPDNPASEDWCINCHDEMNEENEPVQVSDTDSSRSEDSSSGDSNQYCRWSRDGQACYCPSCGNL